MAYYHQKLLSATAAGETGYATTVPLTDNDINGSYKGDFKASLESTISTTGVNPIYFNRDTEYFRHYNGSNWVNIHPLHNFVLDTAFSLWFGKNDGALGSSKVNNFGLLLNYLRTVDVNSPYFTGDISDTQGSNNPPRNVIVNIVGSFSSRIFVRVQWEQPIGGPPDYYEYTVNNRAWGRVSGSTTRVSAVLTTSLNVNDVKVRAITNNIHSAEVEVGQDDFVDTPDSNPYMFVYYDKTNISEDSNGSGTNIKKVTTYTDNIESAINITADILDKSYINRAVTFDGFPFEINDPKVRLALDNDIVIGTILGYSNKKLEIAVDGWDIKFINGTPNPIPIGSKIIGKTFNNKGGYIQPAPSVELTSTGETNLWKSRGSVNSPGDSDRAGTSIVKAAMKFGAW